MARCSIVIFCLLLTTILFWNPTSSYAEINSIEEAVSGVQDFFGRDPDVGPGTSPYSNHGSSGASSTDGLADNDGAIDTSGVKEESRILENFDSYSLFEKMSDTLETYWLTMHYRFIKNGALTTFAQSLLLVFLLYFSVRLIIGTPERDEVKGLLVTLFLVVGSTALAADADFLREVIFDGVAMIPIKISSSFIYFEQLGGQDYTEPTQTLFKNLDQYLGQCLDFIYDKTPTESLIDEPGPFFMKWLFLLLFFILFTAMYLQYMFTFFRTYIMLVLNGVLLPFYLLLVAYKQTRPYFFSLCKSTYYHSIVLVINSIIISMILVVYYYLVGSLSSMRNNASLFSADYAFILIWCAIGFTLLASVSSIAAQLTESRGVSGGGGSLLAVAGGALAASKLGKKTINNPLTRPIGNKAKQLGGDALKWGASNAYSSMFSHPAEKAMRQRSSGSSSSGNN